jgi:hypothetical protein
MGNPPGWVMRTRSYSASSGVHMPGVTAGLVTAAEVNTQPDMSGGGQMPVAKWSVIWFVVATLYLLGIYYGTINVRSSAS